MWLCKGLMVRAVILSEREAMIRVKGVQDVKTYSAI